ncbi:MAG: protein kinase [Actinomycetota bacterium]
MPGVKHRIGGYRVIAPIGAGGFATVFRALDESTGKEVAIKVLAENHSLVPDTRRRFEEEMGLLMTVKSPSIAKMYKVGETETGQPFMVLELADRGDLRRRVEEIRENHQVLNREDLTMLANHLHDGLRHLHGMDIVHRDVSPGNILIRSRRDGGERAPGVTLLEPGERFLLTDLGHAKDMILASGFTAGGGTRGFTSPEQREDVTVVDHRADIFAATAILEWAAHDGLYAEALDPFFNEGLADNPDDRFETMEEWHTSFSETMAATLPDGTQRSKVGRVMRRLKSNRPIVEDLGQDEIYPEMFLDEKAAIRLPGGVTPPGMGGKTKVVQPPGSPGGHSIGRAGADAPAEETGQSSAAPDETPVGSAGPTSGENPAVPADVEQPAPESTPEQTSAPTTRLDPATILHPLNAPNSDEDSRSRTRNRWLALAVGVLVLVGALAFGLSQELADQTVSAGDADSGGAPVTLLAEAFDEPDTPDPATAGQQVVASTGEQSSGLNDSTAGAPDAGDEEADLLVVDSEDPAGNEPADGVDRPTVTISSPEQNQVLAIDEMTIRGTATAADGIEQVQVSVRNLDTLQYWNQNSGEFGQAWSTVTIQVAATQEPEEADGDDGTDAGEGDVGVPPRILGWTITVPAEDLTPGTYEIRTWLRTSGQTVAPQNDSRTVTVIDPAG